MVRVQHVVAGGSRQCIEIVIDCGDEQHLVGLAVAVLAQVLVPECSGDVVPQHIHGLHGLDVLHVLRQGGAVGGGQGVHIHAHPDLVIVIDQQEFSRSHHGIRILRHRHPCQIRTQLVGGALLHVAGCQQARQRGAVFLAARLSPGIGKGHLLVAEVDNVHGVRRRGLEADGLPALVCLLLGLDPAGQVRPVVAAPLRKGHPACLFILGEDCRRSRQIVRGLDLHHAHPQRAEGQRVLDILLVGGGELRVAHLGGVSVLEKRLSGPGGVVPHDQHRDPPGGPLDERCSQLCECDQNFRQCYSHFMLPPNPNSALPWALRPPSALAPSASAPARPPARRPSR